MLLVLASSVVWADTTVQFSADSGDPATTFAVGPFPTNALTTPDSTQLTGLRVNLPDSEDVCYSGSKPVSSPVCSNKALLNQIDGFSVNPRLMVCFSDRVDAATLAMGIRIVPVNGSDNQQHAALAPSISQIVLDPDTNCVFAKPDHVLKQRTQYLLVVTSSVKDMNGKSVRQAPAYLNCVAHPNNSYCDQLGDAVQHSRLGGKDGLVAASLFTTMTVTNWLEQARQLTDSLPGVVIPAGLAWAFPISKIQQITWNPAPVGLAPPSQDIPLTALSGVESIAFGLFRSPNYLDPAAPVPGSISGSPIGLPALVSFHVFLPTASGHQSNSESHGNDKKGGKIPVVIYGHGLGDSQFGAPTFIASKFAQNGFATLAFEVTGHGFGPDSTVTITKTNGSTSTERTPGRGAIDSCILPGALGIRDCTRQTAVDLFALVHAIRTTHGLGLNLDPQRIYYVGQSLGSISGTLFMAVEPAVRTAVLNGDGGTQVDIARFAITARQLGLGYLATLNDPLLFNVAPPLKAPPEQYFETDGVNDNYVFRDISPLTNDVPGALADQAAFEAADWIDMVGDALAFAPYLQTSPLDGVPSKNVLFQFGYGDLEVPNPTESAVVRGANALSSTSFFQFQLAPELLGVTDPAFGQLPILPHRILSNPTIFDSDKKPELSVALAEQQQAADYFSSDGRWMSNANKYLTGPYSGSNLFVNGPNALPEELGFFPQIPK